MSPISQVDLGQVVFSGKAEDVKHKTETMSFQETAVHSFAECIDAHHKPKRVEDFISDFKSFFETENDRLALTSLHPRLVGSTPDEVATCSLAKQAELRRQSFRRFRIRPKPIQASY